MLVCNCFYSICRPPVTLKPIYKLEIFILNDLNRGDSHSRRYWSEQGAFNCGSKKRLNMWLVSRWTQVKMASYNGNRTWESNEKKLVEVNSWKEENKMVFVSWKTDGSKAIPFFTAQVYTWVVHRKDRLRWHLCHPTGLSDYCCRVSGTCFITVMQMRWRLRNYSSLMPSYWSEVCSPPTNLLRSLFASLFVRLLVGRSKKTDLASIFVFFNFRPLFSSFGRWCGQV